MNLGEELVVQSAAQRLRGSCDSEADLRGVVQGGIIELPGHLPGRFSCCPRECPTLLPELF